MKTSRTDPLPPAVRARLDADLSSFPRRPGHVILLPHGLPGEEIARDDFEAHARDAGLDYIDGPDGLLALIDEAIVAAGCAALVTQADSSRAVIPVIPGHLFLS